MKEICPECGSDFYDIEIGGEERKVFCEMTVEGGKERNIKIAPDLG